MSNLKEFWNQWSKTNLERSREEESERYFFPPQLALYCGQWEKWKEWNRKRKDGLNDDNPYG